MGAEYFFFFFFKRKLSYPSICNFDCFNYPHIISVMPNMVTAVSLASLLTVDLLALVTGWKVIMDANQL